jgi:hypothetical protein
MREGKDWFQKMNKYLKIFLHRGLVFGGFGPIVVGIVYLILQNTLEDFSLSGGEVCTAIISTYLLAFVHAGASVFNGIEEWGLARSLGSHFAALYIAYSICYLINSWIPFDLNVFLIYTAVFAIGYFAVWFTVVMVIKISTRKLNEKLK